MTPEQKERTLTILDEGNDLTIATIREDGYPQATTVSFVHDGFAIYFGCDPNSQKARNIAGCDRVSVTVNLPYSRWEEIRGISLGGRASIVTENEELRHVLELMLNRFPQIEALTTSDEREHACVVRVDPEIVSLLDYEQGFGHTEQFVPVAA